MPKSSGRYFASTIAKLRAFKKAEYIAIDEDLRASLRRELLVRANALDKFQAAPFLEKISKFKRYLALAPIFLLFLAVIVGLSKLSVQFKESAFIPVVPFQIETSQKSDQKPVSVPFIGVVRSTLETSQKLETTQTPEQAEVSKTVKITDTKNKQTIVTGERVSDGAPQSSSVVIAPSGPVTISGSQIILPASPIYPTKPLAPEPSAYIVPQSTVPAVLVPQPLTPVPVESKPMLEIKTVTPSPTTGKAPNVIEQPTPYKQPSSKAVDEKPAVVKESVKVTPNTVQPAITSVPTADKQPAQYEEMYSEPQEMEIYFKGRFSNDERVLLRDNVIPGLVENKHATYVQVRETPNEGFAVIEIYLDNQDVETYIYNLHEHMIVQG